MKKNNCIVYCKNSEQFDLIRFDVNYDILKAEYVWFQEKYVKINIDGITAINSPEQIAEIESPYVVITLKDELEIREIVNELKSMNITFTHYNFLCKREYNVDLMRFLDMTSIIDENNNSIIITANIKGNTVIKIDEKVRKSEVIIKNHLTVYDNLTINVTGSESKVKIGERNEFVSAVISCAAKGEIEISDDCIFVNNVTIRQGDANFNGNINIGRHVFVGSNSMILGGSWLGSDVIIKSGSVISASYFKNTVIEGYPAGIRYTDMMWTRREDTEGIALSFTDCDYKIGLIPLSKQALSSLPKKELKEKNNNEYWKQITNRVLLLLSSNSNTGIFDLLTENNINEFAIYLEEESGTAIISTAKSLSLKISEFFSSKQIKINSPFEYFQTYKFEPLEKSDTLNILVAAPYDKNLNESLVRFGYKIWWLSDLVNYSFYKSLLFEPLLELEKKFPKTKFILSLYSSLKDNMNNFDEMSKLEKSYITEGANKTKMIMRDYWTTELFFKNNRDYEYISNVTASCESIYQDGLTVLKDFESKYRNVKDNRRVTAEQPENPLNSIYMFGGSVIFGYGIDDANTIASVIQRQLNADEDVNGIYEVTNCANISSDFDLPGLMNYIKSCEFKPDDIAVITVSVPGDFFNDYLSEMLVFNWKRLFKRPHEHGEIYLDQVNLNETGSNIAGKALYKFIKENVL